MILTCRTPRIVGAILQMFVAACSLPQTPTHPIVEYPNYFDVGIAAGPTSKPGVPPVTYTEIDCSVVD